MSNRDLGKDLEDQIIDEQLDIFASRLVERRKQLRLKPIEAAEKVGVCFSVYSNWERGYTFPSVKNLLVIANVFIVSIDWLFGREKSFK